MKTLRGILEEAHLPNYLIWGGIKLVCETTGITADVWDISVVKCSKEHECVSCKTMIKKGNLGYAYQSRRVSRRNWGQPASYLCNRCFNEKLNDLSGKISSILKGIELNMTELSIQDAIMLDSDVESGNTIDREDARW